MLTVYACLTGQHDYRLVLLAAVVCIFASTMAVKLLRRVAEDQGHERLLMLAIAACVTGMGVWATHFIAMLAFEPHVKVGYDLGLTLLSLAVAVGVIGLGFHISLSPRTNAAPALGGAVIGLAIGAMHYLGMMAFQVEGRVLWDMPLVIASLVIGVGFGATALSLAIGRAGAARQAGAVAMLTLAICGLHFTGMGATSIAPDSSVQVAASSLPGAWLAIGVATGAFGLLLFSAAGLLLEQAQHRAEHTRRHELANTAVEGLVVCDDGVIVNANASFEAMVGKTEAALIGKRFADLLDPAAEARLTPGQSERFETSLTGPDGQPVPVELIARPLTFNGRSHQGVAVRDLSARNLADAQIRFLAHHDALTGLDNRASFNDRLDREIERRRRKDDALAVLYLDLDRFKPINDMFGHAAGDAVLKEISRRVAAELDADDVFARVGGDEFAVIRLADNRPAALADLSSRILAACVPEMQIDGRAALVGVSIGIAMFPADGEESGLLLRHADAALYRAKADGRGGFRFFEPSIGADLLSRQGMEFDLRMAVARGELRLAYQPQTDVASGVVFGFESLLRWRHPTRGEVPPDVFIPVAEETGQILAIGEWVLRQACAEAATWGRPLQIAVNLSGVQLHSANLAKLVADVLAETGLDPQRLELEITETALIMDFDRALKTLHQIKALGVKVAMDDFGTGYSSLSNLRAFPFDKIKIDQSFVRDVHCNDQAATIVRAIVGLAKGLKLTVLAEGVESLEELNFLNAEMCGEAQGYYFGRPGDISDFEALLAAPKPLLKKAV